MPSRSFEERHDLPAAPAVYFVLNNRLEIRYVGETRNLCRRWRAHHVVERMNGESCRIYWYRVDDTGQRKNDEQLCIGALRPSWNRQDGYHSRGWRFALEKNWGQACAYFDKIRAARQRGVEPSDLIFADFRKR